MNPNALLDMFPLHLTYYYQKLPARVCGVIAHRGALRLDVRIARIGFIDCELIAADDNQLQKATWMPNDVALLGTLPTAMQEAMNTGNFSDFTWAHLESLGVPDLHGARDIPVADQVAAVREVMRTKNAAPPTT